MTTLTTQPIHAAPSEAVTVIALVSHWKNAAWNIGGMLGYNAARWITVVAIARLAAPTLLGEYALATAIVAPFFLFANLQLPGLLATDSARKHSWRAYLLVGVGGCVVAVSLAVLFASQEGRVIAVAVAFFAIARSIDSVSELIGGKLQRSGRFQPIAIGQVINGALTAGATMVVLQSQPRTAALAIASIVGSAIALAFVYQSARRGESGDLQDEVALQHLGHDVRALLRLGLPMGCAAGLIGLGNSVPTIVLDQWVDKVQLGIFSAVSLPVVGIGMLVASLSQVGAPRLAALITAGQHDRARRHIVTLLALGFGIGMLATASSAVAGGWFLASLYGEEYRSLASVLVILCVGAAIRCGYLYVGVVLMVIRKPHVQLYARALALIALGAALWLLIPDYGIAGAAWAILIATIVEAVVWAAILTVIWRTLDRAN